MNDYIDFSAWDFFYHCVLEEKSYFLKHALRKQYFDMEFMNRPQLINTINYDLRAGMKIIFYLNLLLFTDFKKWTLTQLK